MSDNPLPPLPDDLVTGPLPPDPTPDTTPGRTIRTMSTHHFKIGRGELGFSLTDPAVPVADDTLANYTDFSCRVTSGMVEATAEYDTDEVPGTFCDTATSTRTPRDAAYELAVDVLQDPDLDDTTGLATFLWDNQAAIRQSPVWFYLGLAQGAAPKITGRVWLEPMSFGGAPRTVLTDSLRLPIEGRPTPEYGTTADA